MSKIRIGIVGYGNLGRGVEASITQQPDMELVAVFTRRSPDTLTIATPNVPVVHVDDANTYESKIDVLILCGGSATDLPEQVPHFAKLFNTVDSFDTHANIPAFFDAANEVASEMVKFRLFQLGGIQAYFH